MKLLHWIIGGLAILCLAGWLGMRTPYSPSQDLPLVAYTAFDFQDIEQSKSEALLQDARNWDGITAATYNPDSRIMVLSHEERIPAQDLLTRLSKEAGAPIAIKVFPEPAGPKCPVPHGEIMAAFPTWLFYGGVAFSLLFGFSMYRNKRQTASLN